jgi:ankyrin repeat protein
MDTIIYERIRDGRTDLVLDLVHSGHPATATDDQGVSLMAWCAYYGDVTAIRFLEANGAPTELLGENLDLNGAAFHGHWRLCQYLLEQGADPNYPMPDTAEVPLHVALSRTTTTSLALVVELLLAHGAEPNRRTATGVETGALMRDARTRAETPLHRAAAFSTASVITRLLAAGADREARDLHGDSPLAWASWHLRPAHVLDLLCFGPHTITESASATSREPHDANEARGMERFLIGRPHFG